MQNFMKTIINAVQFWTKKLIKDSTADWSQNDSTADNYVKNRTHWEETNIITLVDNLTSEDYRNGNNIPRCNFVPEQTYNVIWNGVLYEGLVCYFDGDYNVIAERNDECPFYIDDDGGNGLFIETASEYDKYTVSIFISETTVHKIDEKYLPELTATPDWNQSDPEAKDYIKNRPFYEEIENVVWVEKQTITIESDGRAALERMGEDWPSVGIPYIVNFDDVKYTGTVYEDSDVCTRTDFTTANGEYVKIYDGYNIYAPTSLAGVHTIEIIYQIPHVYHIDSKFLSFPAYGGEREDSICINNRFNVASGYCSYAEGDNTTASGRVSHAEGYRTTASGDYSHAEGNWGTASGDYSHAEGKSTTASGNISHAEGTGTKASGDYSHAEGYSTTASGDYSHAEGYSTQATSDVSAIVSTTNSTDAGYAAHTEGYGTVASGVTSHAEGNGTKASGNSSHAEGYSTTASGNSSHAEGYSTTASGNYSHVEGYNTIAYNKSQHVFGEFNVADLKYIEGIQKTNIATTFDKSKTVYVARKYTFDRDLGFYTLVNAFSCTGSTLRASFTDSANFSKNDVVYLVVNTEPTSQTMYKIVKNGSSHGYTYSNLAYIYSPTVYSVLSPHEGRGEYVSVVGNGTSDTSRSNAHTLDWDGNAWFAGNVKIGGINQYDEASKELATKDYVDAVKHSLLLIDIENNCNYNVYIRNGNLCTSCKCTSIKITTLPNKIDYAPGDIFDPTGMVVTAFYEDGSEKIIDNYTYPTEGLESGRASVVISYSEFGVTYETSLVDGLIVDFEWTDNGDGTVTLTGWKETLNGTPSTELIVPEYDWILV